MSPQRSRMRLPRRRIFLGCEGRSEFGYAARLKEIIEEIRQDLHIQIEDLRGGDSLVLLQKCQKIIKRNTLRRELFEYHALLLDGDQRGIDTTRDAQSAALASSMNIPHLARAMSRRYALEAF